VSSVYVRTEVETFIGVELPSETALDVTAQFDYLQDFLADNGVGIKDRWLGLQYVGNDEVPISIASNNTQGCYRETGSIFIHIVEPVSNNSTVNILTRSENIRNKFRGQSINGIRIESVTPPNFESGATLNFDGGYTAAAVVVNYEYDINL